MTTNPPESIRPIPLPKNGGSGTPCDQLLSDIKKLNDEDALLRQQLNNATSERRAQITQQMSLVEQEIESMQVEIRNNGCMESTPVHPPDFQQLFSSPIYGDIIVYGIILLKWKQLASQTTTTGASVQTFLGNPIIAQADYSGIRYQYFERGIILYVVGSGVPYVVYGPIYGHYREMGDVRSWLGVPLADERPADNGGRFQPFEQGDMYWQSDSGARAVSGFIRDHWNALGATSSFLGFPVSDVLSVKNGNAEVGQSSRFQGGMIYWKPGVGAFEVHGAIRDTWENQYNGVLGTLGFPLSDEQATPAGTGRYSNFEHGCIVSFGSGPFVGTKVFTSLQFSLIRFNSNEHGDFLDGAGETPDLYVDVNVNASTGQAFQQRLPSTGNFGKASWEGPLVLFTVPVVRGDLVINASFTGWDEESVEGNTHLGTVKGVYTSDNLWTYNLYSPEKEDHWDGTFMAAYQIGPGPGTFNPATFRQDMFWQFINPGTKRLSWSDYADTFSDVAEGELTALHLFDQKTSCMR